jgi:hypothetical protein
MKCEEAVEILRSTEHAGILRLQAARSHVEGCADCEAALRAVSVLRAEHYGPALKVPPQSFARALERATHAPRTEPRRYRGFWLGTGVGGAIAAGIAITIAALWPQTTTAPLGNPAVLLAVDEVRAVSMALDSPEALADAEIHVVLTGGVGVQGFPGQRELRWMTDLARGVNQLTLPLVGLDANGGQVTVEVHHGTKQRTFIIDVQPTGRPTARVRETV